MDSLFIYYYRSAMFKDLLSDFQFPNRMFMVLPITD